MYIPLKDLEDATMSRRDPRPCFQVAKYSKSSLEQLSGRLRPGTFFSYEYRTG